MTINTITTKELRQKFPQVKKAVDHGQSFVLIYRSKPFAELRPLPRVPKRKVSFDIATLPAFGMWKERINRAGGSEKFLAKLREEAWK